MTEKTYLSCAETAKLVRVALAEKFAGVKFSVRSKTYAGGASISVSWTDGPTTTAVEAVVNKFEGASFDGMIDLKSYHDALLNGKPVHFGSDYVSCSRHYSLAAYTALVDQTCQRWGLKPAPPVVVSPGWGPHVENAYSIQTTGGRRLDELLHREAADFDLYTPPARPAPTPPAPRTPPTPPTPLDAANAA